MAIGGGSTTGLGKAIALDSGLPIIAIPTTYAGSEMTPIYGLTEGGVKKTGRDARVLPKTVIYDPKLTLTLPLGLSVTSGMNAIAHAVEGLYAQDAQPGHVADGRGGHPRLRRRAAAAGDAIRSDLDARARLRSTAPGCAAPCSAPSGWRLHHKLCHTLGGTFNLPHAETHTVVLPHALAYNAPAAPEAMARIARALGAPTPPQGLFDLASALGAPVVPARHRHARRPARPGGRPRRAVAVLESAADRARRHPQAAGRRLARAAAGLTRIRRGASASRSAT